jgi:hypothetical protein
MNNIIRGRRFRMEQGDWTPIWMFEFQHRDGQEYQSYGIDAEGKIVHAGVTRHTHMDAAEARKVQRTWVRWRREYNANVPGDYPARNVHTVSELIVFPIDNPDQQTRVRFDS